MQRPDLSNVDPVIVAYIEYLEKKAGARQPRQAASDSESADLPAERAAEALPPEREGNVSIITFCSSGLTKRTLRHLYTRQHRGGMGVFGMDIDPPDAPVLLADAEENQTLLYFTNRARVYRHNLNAIPLGQVFAKGSIVTERFGLEPDERIVAILPVQARGYVSMVTRGGRVRSLRHHVFGEHMRQGTAMFNTNDFGPLASVAWSPGDADLFLVTQEGIGIRFAEKAISPQGDTGIRLSGNDKVVGLTPVYPDSSVFIIGADGRGTMRQMSGFAANKTPGGSGKIAMKSSKVVGATTAAVNDDLFIISRLGKIIRFPADEVPTTEGVVQGVNCMGLRADEVVALLKSGPIY